VEGNFCVKRGVILWGRDILLWELGFVLPDQALLLAVEKLRVQKCSALVEALRLRVLLGEVWLIRLESKVHPLVLRVFLQ